MSGAIGPALREELRQAAEPVAREARTLVAQWPGSKPEKIGPRVVVAGAFVTQRARKVTGLRKDFGALQMRRAMIPALEHNADAIERAAYRAVDAIARGGGF